MVILNGNSKVIDFCIIRKKHIFAFISDHMAKVRKQSRQKDRKHTKDKGSGKMNYVSCNTAGEYETLILKESNTG